MHALNVILAGIQVDYKRTVAGISPGLTTIRCLLLCWTGDHPAQFEISKFLGSGGLSACRRINLTVCVQ